MSLPAFTTQASAPNTFKPVTVSIPASTAHLDNAGDFFLDLEDAVTLKCTSFLKVVTFGCPGA